MCLRDWNDFTWANLVCERYRAGLEDDEESDILEDDCVFEGGEMATRAPSGSFDSPKVVSSLDAAEVSGKKSSHVKTDFVGADDL